MAKKFFYFVLVYTAFAGQLCATEQIGIQNAWLPEAPPVMKIMAGYLVIKNPTDKIVNIVKVTSPDFQTVEMHESVIKDGMARMIKQPQVAIPAKSQIEFKSGGLHLMLINKKRKLKTGDEVLLTFEFDKGKKVTTKAMVKPASADTMDHSHHQH